MKNITPLCEIAYKYGTDKCPQIAHNYTPVYYKLLKGKRKTVKKVLELGIGSRQTIKWVPDHYQTGASLLMWRDFFPNATVYGVDRDPSAIFQSERVETFLLSTANIADLQNLIERIGSDIDLVVDDGPHNERFQIQTARTLLPLLNEDCVYIIEDVRRPYAIKDQLSEYNCQVIAPDLRNESLIIIKNHHKKKADKMKNLMLYINPTHQFDEERGALAKVQIDNSLRLGWKPKDILVVTNFEWQYGGIKSLVVDDSNYCTVHDKASKINVFLNLIGSGTIKDGEIYWFHDFDAFQVKKFTEKEIIKAMEGMNVGFADYGWKQRWNTGSIFLTSGANKVFEWIRNELYGHRLPDEEEALTRLTNRNYKNINQMYTRLNITYDFPACLNGIKRIASNYQIADQPIRVLHFHPFYRGVNYLEKNSGNNPLKKNLIPKGLRTIFKKHLPELSQNI